MNERESVFRFAEKLKSRFPPTFSWIYRKDLFNIIDDVVKKELTSVFEVAEIEVRKEAMERLANRCNLDQDHLVDKQN